MADDPPAGTSQLPNGVPNGQPAAAPAFNFGAPAPGAFVFGAGALGTSRVRASADVQPASSLEQ